MNTQLILTRWKESLDFFSRSSLSIFGLLTLNTVRRAALLILSLHGWLYTAAMGIAAILFFGDQNWLAAIGVPTWTDKALMAAFFIIRIPLLYLLILSLRPSLERKDYSYYTQYLNGFWFVAIMSCFMTPGSWVLVFTMLLCFFDGPCNVKSLPTALRRAGYFFLYFLPIYLVLTTVALLLSYLSTSTGDYVIIRDIFMLLVGAATTVYYTKIKFSYFQLLFN